MNQTLYKDDKVLFYLKISSLKLEFTSTGMVFSIGNIKGKDLMSRQKIIDVRAIYLKKTALEKYSEK
jgi:hypothetical protein